MYTMVVGRNVLGENHLSTLGIMESLGSTYRGQGRWKEAEELDERVMETRKRVLEEEHPDTLASMHSLVSTYIGLDAAHLAPV
jgi:Tetratricopeptide repeat